MNQTVAELEKEDLVGYDYRHDYRDSSHDTSSSKSRVGIMTRSGKSLPKYRPYKLSQRSRPFRPTVFSCVLVFLSMIFPDLRTKIARHRVRNNKTMMFAELILKKRVKNHRPLSDGKMPSKVTQNGIPGAPKSASGASSGLQCSVFGPMCEIGGTPRARSHFLEPSVHLTLDSPAASPSP